MKAGRQKKGQKSQKSVSKFTHLLVIAGSSLANPGEKQPEALPRLFPPDLVARSLTHMLGLVRVSARMCAPCSSVRDWALLSRALLAGWEKPPAAPCVCVHQDLRTLALN